MFLFWRILTLTWHLRHIRFQLLHFLKLTYCWRQPEIPGINSPVEGKVGYPIIYDGLKIHPRWFSPRISEPSTVAPIQGFDPCCSTFGVWNLRRRSCKGLNVLTKWKHLWNRFFLCVNLCVSKKMCPDHEKEWEFSDLCSLVSTLQNSEGPSSPDLQQSSVSQWFPRWFKYIWHATEHLQMVDLMSFGTHLNIKTWDLRPLKTLWFLFVTPFFVLSSISFSAFEQGSKPWLLFDVIGCTTQLYGGL